MDRKTQPGLGYDLHLNLKRFKLVSTMREENDGGNQHFPSFYRLLGRSVFVSRLTSLPSTGPFITLTIAKLC